MEEVRKQFEAWAVGMWLERDSSGDYISRDAQRAWGIWVPAFSAGAAAADSGRVLVNAGDSESDYIASAAQSGTTYTIGEPLSPEAATQALRDQGVIVDFPDLTQFRQAVLDQFDLARQGETWSRHSRIKVQAAEAERDRLLALIDAQAK